MAAKEEREGLGFTVLRGAAWGLGFTAMVGLMRWTWQKATEATEDDDDKLYHELDSAENEEED